MPLVGRQKVSSAATASLLAASAPPRARAARLQEPIAAACVFWEVLLSNPAKRKTRRSLILGETAKAKQNHVNMVFLRGKRKEKSDIAFVFVFKLPEPKKTRK